MLSLPGFDRITPLDEDTHSRVYRGVDLRDNSAVTLKTPLGDPPEPRFVERLRFEHAMLTELDGEGAPRPRALIEHGRSLVLVVESIEGVRLDALLRAAPLTIDRFLEFALLLVDALAHIHRHKIIHRDLRPHNVVVNKATGELKIVDFGAASRLPRELRQATALDQLEGALAYISPEQTGRMNRAVDYRSDFYALGVTFYEMLTGQLPFAAQHALELVHSHLARAPEAAVARRPDVPQPLSDIVQKLLAKLAEDRYQSTAGLLFDLRRCQQAWLVGRRVEPFALGAADVSDRFQIAQGLYGREAESAALLATFERVATKGSSELMLVAGYAGVGKTVLVEELHKQVLAQHGLFIQGRVDRHRTDLPYAAIAEALRGLIQQLLADSAPRLTLWRQRLLDALGDNAQVIVDLVPQLHLIVGAQPRLAELPPEQSQARLHRSVQRFVSVFARAEHPLVLFIDDLQWSDAGSVALLAQLASNPQTRHLLMLGACRENEVDAAHPLARLRAELDRRSVPNATIALAPLQREHIAKILADTLRCGPTRAAELAGTVYSKTRGNPFFTFQFITALHNDRLIRFDHAAQGWTWNAAELASRDFTDNVVELMLAELTRLPAATREVVALAGLLGSPFSRATLAIVGDRALRDAEDALRPAVQVGLLSRNETAYRFLHERVQEAAGELLPPAERTRLHWHIGGRLQERLQPQALQDRCFEVADHLNLGAADPGAVLDGARRIAAAKLNLIAGTKAQASAAHAAAARHFAAGIALLPEGGWADTYELAFALHRGRAKSAWLAGDADATEQFVGQLLAHARNDIDWADAAQIDIELKLGRHELEAAATMARNCLQRLDIDLPEHPTREQVRQAYDEHLSLLGGRPIESLAELPPMTDPRRIAAMRALTSIYPATFAADINLWALQMCQLLILSQRHGHADASAPGYAVFGGMISLYFGEHERGYRFGELAFELLGRHGAPHDFATVQYQRAILGLRVRPLSEVLTLEREATQGFVEIGNRIAACACANLVLIDALALGEPLAAVEQQADDYLALAQEANDLFGIEVIALQRGRIRALRGHTSRLDDLGLDDFGDENPGASFVPVHGSPAPRARVVDCWFELARLAALSIAGDHAGGHAAARAAEPLLDTVENQLGAHEYHFHDALCIAGLIEQADAADRPALRERLQVHDRHLREWASRNTASFAPSQLLIAAEIARVDALPAQAMPLYERAIAAARAQGLLPIEALANERAARFYRACGAFSAADAHQREARSAYARWGADAKLRQIDAAHPQVARMAVVTPAGASAGSVGQLDALAVVKAAQAISGPMLPQQLMRELLTIVLQQAGAHFGALLLVQEDELVLEGTAHVDGPRIKVEAQARDKPAAAPARVPANIANYVWRSGEQVLLDDAQVANRFSTDASLAGGPARSVLALPILRQSRVTGVLYLEHHGAANVFTLENIAVLEQLAAQAAISIEGSRLYDELAEQKRTLEANVQARTRDLERSRAVLQTMLDSMPAVISLRGLDGRYLNHNRLFAEQVGRAGQSLVGLRSLDLFDAETAARSLELDRRVIESGHDMRIEQSESGLRGNRSFQIHRFPVRDAQGEVHAVGSIAIDITDLKNARLEAEGAAQAKSQFLANMSHEIRTPMNAILGMSHLALRSGLNAQQQSYVQKVEYSARSLLGLINDILDFSKIEAGKLDLEQRAFDLRDVFDNLESVIGLQAAEKGLELLFSIAPDVPAALIGDPLRLGQVLINLGNNAIKFTERGEVTVRVEVLERDGADVLLFFSMRDSGVGMSAEQQERLFRPFVQADASTSRRFGGTGLGLAISEELVKLLGGSIDVESEPGAGSTFRFSARLGLQPNPATVQPPPAEGSRNIRVLVVDDNEAAREVIASASRGLGWQAETARDGWDAARAVTMAAGRAEHFDLVLLDSQMPGMDGAECAQHLAQTAHGARPVVLMSTAFGREGLMKRLASLQITPAAVISKPVMPSALLEAWAVAQNGPDRPSPHRPRVESGGTGYRAQLRGTRVLLVEDNPINQELALELLRDAGMEVAVAEHGREAIDMLVRERFDLVLMDCQMPVLDGYDATREIRAQPQWATLPIIAMTANAMAGDRRKALESGMNDHIAKPIDVERMFKTIASWVHKPAAPVAPAVVAAPPAGPQPLVLSGIDSVIGLASAMGNEKLYRRLLVKFRNANANFVTELRSARTRNDSAAAARLAHDLRAVAGTLGAKAIVQPAQSLEMACRDGDGDARIEVLLAHVERELAPVLEALAALGA